MHTAGEVMLATRHARLSHSLWFADDAIVPSQHVKPPQLLIRNWLSTDGG